MQSSFSLLVAVAALAATQSVNAAQSVFAASTSQCSSLDTCYAGGASSTPCTISNGGCPPCITFADKGCYVKVNGACPFGVDCASAWSGSSTSSGTDAPTTTDPNTSPTNSDTTSSTTSLTPSTNAETPSTSSDTSNTTGTSSDSKPPVVSGSGSTAADTASSGGSDMSVVFAIIGASIGVIAVAVIFLTLVRRSKAGRDEDEDDIANSPPAFSKGSALQASHGTTGMYSSYNGSNRTPGMGSGTGSELGLDASKGVSMNAVSYYNQQPPHNSVAPSPRVAGRAIPSQPVGISSNTGLARSYGSNQNFGVSNATVTSGLGGSAISGFTASGVSAASGLSASGLGSSGIGVNRQQHPTGGVAPSPHTRKDSFEF